MEISADKTKLITNNANGISVDIRINGEKLDEVDSFKHLGAVVRNQGSKPQVLSRIALTTTALARLETIWNDKHISLSFKTRLIFNALPGYLSAVHLERLRNLDIDSEHPEEIEGHWDEML